MGFHQGHQITQLWHPVSHLRYCGKITHLGCWKYQSAISSYLWHRNRHGEFHIVGVIKKTYSNILHWNEQTRIQTFRYWTLLSGESFFGRAEIDQMCCEKFERRSIWLQKKQLEIIKEEAKPRKVSPEVFSTAAQHVIFYLQTESSYFYWKQQSRMPQSLH